MPKLKNLPHIILPTQPGVPRFTSPKAGGGSTRTKKQDREVHGKKLKAEYLSAVAGSDKSASLRLEFESEPGFDLHLESLDPNARRGFELLNVRSTGGAVLATVLVERERLSHFLQLFEDYLTKTRGPKAAPANRTFVESIAHVRRASVRSLWTDPSKPFPDDGVAVWWEAWLRNEPNALSTFRQEAKKHGIETSRYALTFVDRIVLNLRATVSQISSLLESDALLAELRHPTLSTAEFLQLAASEQWEWSADLLQRLKMPADSAPVVCLLDTGVTRAHPLLEASLPVTAWHTVDESWGKGDTYGHGTHMAGLALLGDLERVLASNALIELANRLESVKLIPAPGNVHNKDSYGAVTLEGIARAELASPSSRRLFCMTITGKEGRDRGRPTSWSAALDSSSSGQLDGVQRLILISAGDADVAGFAAYPNSNLTDPVHDPAQAWNALTVGAFADRNSLVEPDFAGWKCVAPIGGLCPSSTTSVGWDDAWPIKPEIVMPGGNAAVDANGKTDFPNSLCIVSTHHAPMVRPFVATGETSAAVALASHLGARVQARYPQLWPETIRALLVHAADWNGAMTSSFPKTKKGKPKKPKRAHIREVLRTFGYGIPNEELAMTSASDCLTLIKQDVLQPYDRFESRLVTKDMHLYELPWPVDELNALGATEVELRVTLSYFVEPLPGERGYGQNQRHRYASHGLRFDVKTGEETPEQFATRINKEMRAEDESATSKGDSAKWLLGADLRSAGSLHHDRWTGPAATLAARNFLAVYPVVGWWRERPRFEKFGSKARYALVVSIRTPGVETDIYTSVATKVGVPVAIPT